MRETWLKRPELILLKGSALLNNELDIIQMINTIHKLKAGLTALISSKNKKEERDILKMSKTLYLNHTTIYSDSDE